jgi:hypothetical protein
MDSLPAPHGTPASLARQPHPMTQNYNNLTDWDVRAEDGEFNMRPLPRPTRSTMDTDLEGYQFRMGGEEGEWPVPPGYTARDERSEYGQSRNEQSRNEQSRNERSRNGQRESGVGYSINGREGMAGGNAFLDLGGSDGRDDRGGSDLRELRRERAREGLRERMRSARGVHEGNGVVDGRW